MVWAYMGSLSYSPMPGRQHNILRLPVQVTAGAGQQGPAAEDKAVADIVLLNLHTLK